MRGSRWDSVRVRASEGDGLVRRIGARLRVRRGAARSLRLTIQVGSRRRTSVTRYVKRSGSLFTSAQVRAHARRRAATEPLESTEADQVNPETQTSIRRSATALLISMRSSSWLCQPPSPPRSTSVARRSCQEGRDAASPQPDRLSQGHLSLRLAQQ